MKRQQHGLNNTPSPGGVPFAEDLIFWAPLTEGDLTDHISGVTGEIQNGTTVTWDSSKGMYLIDTTRVSSTTWSGGLWFPNSINLTKDTPFTIYIEAETSYSNGNGWECIFGAMSSNQVSYI